MAAIGTRPCVPRVCSMALLERSEYACRVAIEVDWASRKVVTALGSQAKRVVCEFICTRVLRTRDVLKLEG